jgi:hypothetical protein
VLRAEDLPHALTVGGVRAAHTHGTDVALHATAATHSLAEADSKIKRNIYMRFAPKC